MKIIVLALFFAALIMVYSIYKQPQRDQDFVRTFGPDATVQTVTAEVQRLRLGCQAAEKEENGFWRAATAGNPYVVVQEDRSLQRERIRFMFRDRLRELEGKTDTACGPYRWAVQVARYKNIYLE